MEMFSSILSVPPIPLLYAVNKHGLDTLTAFFSACEYRWTLEAGIMPWTVEAMVTTRVINPSCNDNAIIWVIGKFNKSSRLLSKVFLAVTGHSLGIQSRRAQCCKVIAKKGELFAHFVLQSINQLVNKSVFF